MKNQRLRFFQKSQDRFNRLKSFTIRIFYSLLLMGLFLESACIRYPNSGIQNSWTQQLPSSQQTTSDETDDETSSNFLKITALNVGQGDATLITTPNGKNLLIDGGRDGKGRDVILPYLKSRGISSLEAVVVTHYDGDHLGGIDEVIAGEDEKLGSDDDWIPKLGVYDRGGYPFDNAPFYSSYLQASGEHRKTLAIGETVNLDINVEIRCVAVNGKVQNGENIDLSQPGFSEIENSASIALLITYGNFTYLTSGDLTGGGSPGGYKTLDVETPLAKVVGPVTAVHANHHGSLSSSNEIWIETLQPELVFFSVGNENDYHHPAQEVLERWQATDAEIWLTEKGSGGFVQGEHVVNGSIELRTDGENFEMGEDLIPLN